MSRNNRNALKKSSLKPAVSVTSKTKSSSPDSSCTTLDAETQEQFETELCWCIQQLQRTLNHGKLNQKQVQENTRILNSLMNNSTPFVKKRQLMRLTFGDYRAKMLKENERLPKGVKAKIAPAKPSNKSVFLKKSVYSSREDNSFKFNFDVSNPADTGLSSSISKVAITEDAKFSSKQFHFTNSNDTFKFNFKINES